MQNKPKSVLIFFLLVFAISIPFWVLDTVYPVEMLPGLPISALGTFAPAVAAVILVYKDGGTGAAWQLLRRSFDFNRMHNKIWLLCALLVNPIIAVLAYMSIMAAGIPLPGPAPLTFAILPLFIFFFIGALGEEIGWTGYATEPLQQHWGILIASIILGIVGSVWHYIPLLQAHRSMEWIAWWTLATISLRMIMGWLYIHTEGSVFAAAVFHAMINMCWQLFPINGSFYDPKFFGLLSLLFALAILTADRSAIRRSFIVSEISTTRKITWQ
jgi:membrane protease YdiL (CAAX protease family)